MHSLIGIRSGHPLFSVWIMLVFSEAGLLI